MRSIFAACTLLGTAAWFAVFWTSRHAAPEPPSPVLMVGMSVFLGLCCGVLTTLAAMVVRGVVRPAPSLSLALPGERPLATVRANHFEGWEGRGGTLHLTTHSLRFVPHGFNFDTRCVTLDLQAIGRMRVGVHLIVEAPDRPHRFVVPDPEGVARGIEAQRDAHARGAFAPLGPPWVPVARG